jgi:hypothetical protein
MAGSGNATMNELTKAELREGSASLKPLRKRIIKTGIA